ncbi:MAG: hypothetical protein HYX52_08745 [Chloroflexi bacterium]|nr:hypothetical protein [Chloroflexota bacterium]
MWHLATNGRCTHRGQRADRGPARDGTETRQLTRDRARAGGVLGYGAGSRGIARWRGCPGRPGGRRGGVSAPAL